MLTYRVGHGGAAGATAMSNYLHMETLTPEQGEAAAYYFGSVPPSPATLVAQLGQEVHEGGVSYTEALDMLSRAEGAVGDGQCRVTAAPSECHGRDPPRHGRSGARQPCRPLCRPGTGYAGRLTGGRFQLAETVLGLLLLSALWAGSSLRTDLFPQFGADPLSSAQR